MQPPSQFCRQSTARSVTPSGIVPSSAAKSAAPGRVPSSATSSPRRQVMQTRSSAGWGEAGSDKRVPRGRRTRAGVAGASVSRPKPPEHPVRLRGLSPKAGLPAAGSEALPRGRPAFPVPEGQWRSGDLSGSRSRGRLRHDPSGRPHSLFTSGSTPRHLVRPSLLRCTPGLSSDAIDCTRAGCQSCAIRDRSRTWTRSLPATMRR